MSNLKCAVVCIARLEGRYLQEWVNHYLQLGFDKCIVADNNHDGDGENLGLMFKDNPNVIVEDCRGRENYQKQAYKELYSKYKDEFDWLLYCDADEFLVLEQDATIQDFIARFPRDCQVILSNWCTMGDNNQIYADYSRPLMERFTEKRPMARSQYDFVDDFHVKSMVKGGLEQPLIWLTPHVPANNLVCYHANGRRCSNSPFQPVDHSVAYLKHFTTKSLQEYCENKLRKGVGDRLYSLFLQTYANRYFLINEKTPEKVEWLKSNGYNFV